MPQLIVNLSRYSSFSLEGFLDNQLTQMINQTNATVDIQSITTPLMQLGEQLTLALVC